MTKTLILSTSFPTVTNPSAGRFVLNLALSLSRLTEVSIVIPSLKGSNEVVGAADGFDVYAFRYAPSRLELLAQQGGGIPAALKKNKFLSLLIPLFLFGFMIGVLKKIRNVDYVQANWIISGFIASIPVFLFRKKMLTTLHGEDVRKLRVSWVHRLMFRFVFIASKNIVCVGKEMFDALLREYPFYESKLVYVSNGIDPRLLTLKRSIKERDKPKKILIVSSLIESKSINQALMALKILSDQCLNVEMDVVGEGPIRNDLELLSDSLGLNKKVRFLGVMDQEEVYKRYVESDVFLICSRAEGRSSVVLEALAAGLPVIGANTEGVRELLESAPRSKIYEFGDIDQLASSIKSMFDEPFSAENVSKDNRNYIQGLALTWDNTARQYIELLTEGLHV